MQYIKDIRELNGFQSFMLSFNPNVYYDDNGMTLEDEVAVLNFIDSREKCLVVMQQ